MLVFFRAFVPLVKLTASPQKLHASFRPAAGNFEYMIRGNGVIELPVSRMMTAESAGRLEDISNLLAHISEYNIIQAKPKS